MVTVQKVEDGAHWGTSLVSILLSLLFTMMWLTILKALLRHSDEDVLVTIFLSVVVVVVVISNYNKIIVF